MHVVSGRSLLFFGLPLLATLIACGAGLGDETDTSESGLAKSGRWTLPEETLEAGAKAKLKYDSPPAWSSKNCGGQLLAGSKQLGAYLRDRFDAVDSVGGYACRANTANKKELSVHGTGRALDVFIPKVGGAADNGRGDEVANWLVEHSTQIGVVLVIWDRTIWQANGKNDRAYGGPHPHDDHIHVELTKDAAALETAWFTEDHSADGGASRRDGGASTDDEDGGDPSDDDHDDVDDDTQDTSRDAGTTTPAPKPRPEPEPTPETTPTPKPEPGDSDPAPSSSTGGREEDDEEADPAGQTVPLGEGGYPAPDEADDDGPGESDSLESTSSKKKKVVSEEDAIASSGCAVARAPRRHARALAPALLAVALGATFVRRRRRPAAP